MCCCSYKSRPFDLWPLADLPTFWILCEFVNNNSVHCDLQRIKKGKRLIVKDTFVSKSSRTMLLHLFSDIVTAPRALRGVCVFPVGAGVAEKW